MGKTFGVRLRDARKDRGWTKEQLARHCEITQAQVCRLERDRRMPSVPNLIVLCDALRVSADTLLGLGER